MTPIQTPKIFAPVSTPAFAIRDLSFIVLAITAAIFVIVGGFAIHTLIRFGRRPPNPQVEPAQVYGSTQIELAWTVDRGSVVSDENTRTCLARCLAS